MKGVFREISERVPIMSKAHRRIAEHILEHRQDATFFTVQELAASCETSTTTVIRFARELGYAGYSEFLRRLRQDALSQPSIIDRFSQSFQGFSPANQDDLFHQTMNGDISNINMTMLGLSREAFDQAVEWLRDAPRIFVGGLRESFSLSCYMLSRLEPIRRNVFQIHSTGGSYIDQIISLKEGDLCIYYAFHAYTRASIQLLGVLRQRKVKIILFTNPPVDAVQDLADILFPCHVRGVSYKNSFVAPMTLTNYLANALAVSDYDRSMQNLQEYEQTILDHKIAY